jgi:hypothetical protein
MEREALKLALEFVESVWAGPWDKTIDRNKLVAAIKAALAQPAHSEWNASLDEAAACIGEIKGFGQATQDSFAVFIQGLKR